jgi:hypothetical protein
MCIVQPKPAGTVCRSAVGDCDIGKLFCDSFLHVIEDEP